MKCIAVLQLGRWESSAKYPNQVEDSEVLKGLKNLRQLRHMPKGLALLSQLQVLKGFVIGEPRPGGNYCKLADLSGLENLRKLSIHTIHVDINKTSDAAKRELISLAKFKKLRSLPISWSRLYDTPKKPPSMMAPVPVPLEKLPLVKLNLHYFRGSKIPDWLMQWELNYLRKLYLRVGSLSGNNANGLSKWCA
ncbi:unnamed protein product [Prunus armeniaca]|uniref:R13L1/DRL21-like LRR repeat region domain-containing protein n=1 Tax=Prunus armeniaca TaxID=36596 RepID=A0A6J5XD02_PRUAR|nr:unnamed protein product [Prunus armeniaca]